MTKKISILLPSLREKLVKQRILDWQLTNSTIDYELVIVSPFEIKDEKVLWLKDNPPFKGSVFATNVAQSFARGDYLVYFSDDVLPSKNCLKNMLDFMETDKKKLLLGSFKMIQKNTTKEIGPFGAYDLLYACYGCISKENLLKLNNILFNPIFLYSWADIDLSLRIWGKMGGVKICENAVVIPQQVEDEIYTAHRNTFQKDFESFVNIWHNKLGKNIEKKDGLINKKLK
jgi:hypothetical protein